MRGNKSKGRENCFREHFTREREREREIFKLKIEGEKFKGLRG